MNEYRRGGGEMDETTLQTRSRLIPISYSYEVAGMLFE